MPEQAAQRVLEQYWDGNLPIDPVHIARIMGVFVTENRSFIRDGVSGYYSIKNGSPTIEYNPNDAFVRIRFTIAHELAHHVYGETDSPRDTNYSFYANNYDPREVRANSFAAALLMPRIVVEYLVYEEKINDVDELARVLDVSSAAVFYRLKNLGIING